MISSHNSKFPLIFVSFDLPRSCSYLTRFCFPSHIPSRFLETVGLKTWSCSAVLLTEALASRAPLLITGTSDIVICLWHIVLINSAAVPCINHGKNAKLLLPARYMSLATGWRVGSGSHSRIITLRTAVPFNLSKPYTRNLLMLLVDLFTILQKFIFALSYLTSF